MVCYQIACTETKTNHSAHQLHVETHTVAKDAALNFGEDGYTVVQSCILLG